MNQRFLTAIGMALVMIPILIFGDYFIIFELFCWLLSMGAAIEFQAMLHHQKPLPIILKITNIVASSLLYWGVVSVMIFDVNALVILLIIISVLLMNTVLMIFIETVTPDDIGRGLLSVLYTSLGFAAFAYLRQESIWMVVFVLAIVMGTDMAAYFFGIRFGKHRLAVKISPKKSIEGAVAGLAFGILIGTLLGYFMDLFAGRSVFFYLMISLWISVIGQIGDLVASKFKRQAQIKDFSNIFPGHGGILDRFDSSMFAALHLVMIMIIIGLI